MARVWSTDLMFYSAEERFETLKEAEATIKEWNLKWDCDSSEILHCTKVYLHTAPPKQRRKKKEAI